MTKDDAFFLGLMVGMGILALIILIVIPSGTDIAKRYVDEHRFLYTNCVVSETVNFSEGGEIVYYSCDFGKSK